jgi:hypothetical protein
MSGSLTMSEAMRVAGGAGDDGPAQPETAATPVLTIPTSAQVTATSEQAAGLSGNIPQRADLLNQKMGQIQQVASMTQRDKAPRTETAALTDDVDDADAGASGRKPVEFAVAVAEQLQKPSTRVSVG